MLILLFPTLGIVTFFLINYLGGRHIQQSYQNDLFDDEFGKSTVFNIAFRIIAPVVVLTFFGLICSFAGLRFEFSCLLISGVTYWGLRVLMWVIKHRTVRSNIAMVLAQAAVSLSLSSYLFEAIGKDPMQSLTPDVRDVSLEFSILAITVIFYILAESPLFRKGHSPRSSLMENSYSPSTSSAESQCLNATGRMQPCWFCFTLSHSSRTPIDPRGSGIPSESLTMSSPSRNREPLD